MNLDHWGNFNNKVKRVSLNSDYSMQDILPRQIKTNRETSPIIPNMVHKLTQSSLNYFKTPIPVRNNNMFISQMDQMQILNEKLRKVEKENRYTNFLPFIQNTPLDHSMSLQPHPQSEKEKKEKARFIDQILSNKNLFQDELQSPSRLLLNRFNEFINQELHSPAKNKENDLSKEDDKADHNDRTKLNECTQKLQEIERAMFEKLNKIEEEQNNTLEKLKYVIMRDKQNKMNYKSNNGGNNARRIINNPNTNCHNMRNMMNIPPYRNFSNNVLRKNPLLFNQKKQKFLQEIAELIDRKLKENKEEGRKERKNTSRSLPHL